MGAETSRDSLSQCDSICPINYIINYDYRDEKCGEITLIIYALWS